MRRENERVATLAARLQSQPGMILDVNSDGETAFHLACQYRGRDAVEFLLFSHPDVVQVADHMGYLPLHWACCNRRLDCDVLCQIMEYYPEALYRVNQQGETPVSAALKRHSTDDPPSRNDLWIFLIKTDPDCVRLATSGAALNRLCRATRSLGLIRAYVEEWPVALGLTAQDPSLPLPLLPCDMLSIPDNNAPTALPELHQLVDRSTQHLLLSLVELVFHDTVRSENSDFSVVHTHLTWAVLGSLQESDQDPGCAATTITVPPTSRGGSLALARSIRLRGCPLGLCRRAFDYSPMQRWLRSCGDIRSLLSHLCRLHTWEAESRPDPSAPIDQLRALVVAAESLDCLFLRLRDSPALFGPSLVAPKRAG